MSIALFIGRFQPFHYGHLDALSQILNDHPQKIIFGIGSSEEEMTWKNPFTYYERKEMIEIAVEKDSNFNFEIVPIPDFSNPQKWVNFILNQIPAFDTIYSGNPYVEFCFRDSPKKFVPLKIGRSVKAINIRTAMAKNLDYANFVPKNIKDYLEKIQAEKRLQEILQFQERLDEIELKKSLAVEKKSKTGDYSIKKILIVEKYTDLECLENKKYDEYNTTAGIEKLQDYHLEHQQTKKFITEQLKKNGFQYSLIKDDKIENVDYKSFSAVMSLGGDGTFLHASKKITSQPIIGVNSQLSKSVGFLTHFNIENVLDLIKRLKSGDFSVEKWDRLSAQVNGLKTGFLALNEIFVGVPKIYKTSHLQIQSGEQISQFFCNGIVVSSFKGSSAFYKSAGGVQFEKGNFGFVVLLPYKNIGNLSESMVLNLESNIKIIPKRLSHELIFDSDESRKITLKQDDQVVISIDPKYRLSVVR